MKFQSNRLTTTTILVQRGKIERVVVEHWYPTVIEQYVHALKVLIYHQYSFRDDCEFVARC